MTIIDSLLQKVALPRMARVRQVFPDGAIEDVEGTLRSELSNPAMARRIRKGARVAVGVGSRGMNNLPLLVSVVVDELKKWGALPFIVPAMGSHGGATAEGQAEVLAALGVTELSAGCPIVSSMETVKLGELDNGLPVLIDREAMQADAIVVINRVKPHTSFSGPIESGLLKMISIGLGKQAGADSCHAAGFGRMSQNIVEMARIKLEKAPFLFGVATVENAYDKIAKVAVLPAEAILEDEGELLLEAKRRMPSILFTPLDVLIVDRMGKNFSGTGTDPHITGRSATPFLETRQEVARMAILDLSYASHGNAAGVGFADICTRRLVDKIDFPVTYANHITSTVLAHAKIPVTMETDQRAVQLAVKTCNVLDFDKLRVVRIRNTLELDTIQVSEARPPPAGLHPDAIVTGPLMPWAFDDHGHLTDIDRW